MAVQFGFVDIEYLFDRPVADVGYTVVREAIDRTLAFYNQRVAKMTSSLVVPTVLAKERFTMPGGGTLQPLDEDGNPLPTLAYEGYDVAYPILGGGDAMGTNRLSRAFMTVEDANDRTRDAQVKDKNFLINHMLAAIFTKAGFTWLDRTRLGYTGAGSLAIMGLANGDSTRYIVGQGSGTGTDDHYLAQAAAISDAANPFPGIYNDLKEHVDTDPTVDVYVPDNLVSPIQLLTNFVEVIDPQIQVGTNQTVLRGTIDKGFGDMALGRVDRCNIILMSKLPSGYMVAINRDQKPLAMREYNVSGFKGLFTEDHNIDGNHYETRFLRFAGFGVRNRTSAVVQQIGSGTYSTPTAFTAPLQAA